MINSDRIAGLPERYRQAVCDAIDTIDNFGVPKLRKVILFGSCSKGTIKAGSDIDLLIVCDELYKDRTRRQLLREDVDDSIEKYGLEADVVYYSMESYINDDSYFTKAVREGICLLERSEIDE